MTQALLHSLNVSTLATWLSVAGFGTVGVVVPQWHAEITKAPEAKETQVLDEDFIVGDAGNPEPSSESDGPAVVEPLETLPEVLPAPPELPPLAEAAPLPEIPDLPVREVAPTTKPSQKAESSIKPTRTQASSRPANSGKGKSASSSQGGVGRSSGAAAGLSDAARIAKGYMPAPLYRSEFRRKGLTGTVVVEFTVDSSGRVISAYAKSPSQWPLLNNEAVRTVRRWKFPPGGVMKLQRPIVFQLR
jgi:periplasmic protein TonB